MHKLIRESLGLNKIFALIEAKGELCSAAKRHKLAKTNNSIDSLREAYGRIERLIAVLKRDRAFAARLEDIFIHMPELAVNHFLQAPELETHEFFELKSFLWHYLQLCNLLAKHKLDSLHTMPELKALFKLLDPEGNNLPAFRISPLYSDELKQHTANQQETALQLIKARHLFLEEARHALELPTLKEEFVISRNRAEVIAKVMGSKYYVLTSENLANYGFRLADSPEALTLKTKLQELANTIQGIETDVKDMLRREVQKKATELKNACSSCSELAWDYTLALFSLQYNCCIPEIGSFDSCTRYPGLQLYDAVNLPLKLSLEGISRQYQALDIVIDQAANLITGPNMGGKSTALITIGQACYLASMGIPIPAKSAKLPLYDEIYYNHDTHDNAETLSSFGREVVSITLALQRKGRKLILLDEFAKGTNPAEGEAICVATIKHLQHSEHTLIAATHFTAPAELEGLAHYSIKGIDAEGFKRLENLPDTSLESRLKLLSEAMDYSLERISGSSTPPRCAVRIATILGLPQGILEQL